MADEVAVKLTGDNAEFRSMLDRSTADATTFAGRIADKVGDKLYGLRDISTAIATALGLNITNIADNMARYLAGLTKEEEEALKRIESLTEQAARINKQTAALNLSEEQKYQQLLNEREKVEGRLQAIKQAAIDLAAKIKKEEEGMLALAQRMHDTELAQLTIAGQSVALRKQESLERLKLADQEALATKELADLGLAIKTAQKAAEKEIADITQKNFSASQAAMEKARDAATKQLSLDERLNVMTGERTLLEEAIAAKKLEGVDYSKDAARVAELTVRITEAQAEKDAEIDEFLADALFKHREISEEKREQIRLTPEQIAAERQLADLAAQRAAEEARIAQMKARAAAGEVANSGTISLGRFSQSSTDYRGMTTANLEGLLARYTATLNAPFLSASGQYYGALRLATLQDSGAWAAQQDAAVPAGLIQDVLNRRRTIQSYVGQYGEYAARGQFGDSYVNEALREMSSVATNTLNTLNTISSQLSSAGFTTSARTVVPGVSYTPGVGFGGNYNAATMEAVPNGSGGYSVVYK